MACARRATLVTTAVPPGETRGLEHFIRKAAAGDADLLAELGNATFVEAFGHLYQPEDLAAFLHKAHSVERYRQLLSDPGISIWIGSDGTGTAMAYGVAGACGLPVAQLAPTAGEIKRLYVRRAGQNLGLGTKLMQVMLAWLVLQRREPLYVGVWSQNHGAQRFYARFAFEKVGEYDFPIGRQLDREFILVRR